MPPSKKITIVMPSSRSVDWQRRLGWCTAIAVSAANLFLHLPISNLCDALYRRIGRAAYESVSLAGIGVLSLAGAAFLLRHRLKALAQPDVLWIGLGLGIMTVAAQQTLLVSNVEVIHFPQFALLAALLLAAGLKPVPAYLATTVVGIGDEAYQYAVIYRGVPNIYLDFNDMVLNAIGAAWAAGLVAVTANPHANGSAAKPRRWVAYVALAAVPFLLWLDPPHLSAVMQPAATGRLYHVLGAAEAVLALALLQLLVARAAALRDRNRSTGSKILATQALIAVIFSTQHGCQLTPPPPASWRIEDAFRDTPATESSRPRRELVVTFWCGPPPAEMNDARAAEIAAAGFNIVGAPCEGAVTPELNRRALDVAARHGLGMWIADRRIDACLGAGPGCNERLAEVVADFGSHPALAGYFVVDEPGPGEFENIAAVVDRLHRLDPEHLAYVNLLPDFMPPEAFEGRSYEEYVGRFLRVVGPRLLSYDHYPFKEGEDRPSFFANLWAIREQARLAGVEFMLIVQAMPHGKYRDPTEAELSWQVFHALAFGARGVSYFAYWTPVQVPNAERWKFRYGLIEDGKPTLHYFQALRINRVARAIAAELAPYDSLAVGDSHGEIGVTPPFGPIEAIEGGTITAGLFRDGDGRLAVLLVNRDYLYGVDALLRLSPGAAPPALFDPATGRWTDAGDLELDLPPGGARLLRFEEKT